MAGPTLTTEAVVLEKRPAASDGWERLAVFTPDEGLISVMVRRRRAKAEAPLDLFDEATLVLEGGEGSQEGGRTWFLRDTQVRTRRPELGRSYACLAAASRLAALATRNPVGAESRPGVYALLRSAFTAFAESDRSDIILFKSLYRFARDEGYPVKEDWRRQLTAADREQVAAILDRPVRGAGAAAETVARLFSRLEDYLRANTEIELE